ncbi:MAG: flagellar biosynthesis protein FlhB [Rhizobiaceae bacterium]
MSESPDKESKTEEPTEKKIRDAIEKGQIPVSKELPILVSILCFLLYFSFAGRDAVFRFSNLLGRVFENADEDVFGSALDVSNLMQTVMFAAGFIVLPLFLVLMVGGLASSFVQNPPRVVADRIAPKLSRVSVAQGWKRQFGASGLAEFLKSTGKLAFASAFVYLALRSAPQTLLEGTLQHTTAFVDVVGSLILDMIVAVALAMAIIAGADLIWTRHHWRQNLRMTKQEVKDEMKQSEGDPIVKARMRSVARDRSRRRMMDAVPTATLVIANPTHYAIALRYKRETDSAPVVVAKGQDLIALRIREIAEEHNVPVFEEVTLARAMYDTVSVDQLIPARFFQAVAELIKILYARQPGSLQRQVPHA